MAQPVRTTRAKNVHPTSCECRRCGKLLTDPARVRKGEGKSCETARLEEENLKLRIELRATREELAAAKTALVVFRGE